MDRHQSYVPRRPGGNGSVHEDLRPGGVISSNHPEETLEQRLKHARSVEGLVPL